MIDWTASMTQTFEYYTVDPGTWKNVRLLDSVTSCSISRDTEAATLGSATIDITEAVGECYIRAYLVAIQNGITEKFPLGVFLVQTPTTSFDGKLSTISLDAYTPLIEMKEKKPPLGYFIAKGSNILEQAYLLSREKVRAPVVKSESAKTVYTDFVADTSDTWLTFLSDLLANAQHHFDLDEMGRILFAPTQDVQSLQPVWTYDDGNSSILYPDIDWSHDLYGIPNVVEVVYSSNGRYLVSRAVNDDPNSPTSTVNRGREIEERVENPTFYGEPTQLQLNEYAENYLSKASTLEHTVTYTHGYCPVRPNDCVRLNYNRMGLVGVKARVISQSIKCEAGAPVTETATFTTKLWR